MASHYINPQDIWNLFYTIYDGNEYACAGAMGNMQVESGLYSDNAENTWNSLTGYSDEWLTSGINNGTISLSEFLQTSWYVNNYGFGYGLSQWTTESRRRKLWEFTIDAGLDIDSQVGQFNYITWEWTDTDSSYHSLLSYMKNVQTIEDATRYYCNHYEVGTWTSLRLTYAQNWYSAFAGSSAGSYTILVNITGNGIATVYPTVANQGDTITLTVTPNSGESLINIDARTTSGYSVALYVQTGSQTFTMPSESVIISVEFSGTTPTPTPRTIHRMPIMFYLKKRRII